MFDDPENFDDFINENGADQPGHFYLKLGCLFPDECCMPGEHFTCECHTPEMLIDQMGEDLS